MCASFSPEISSAVGLALRSRCPFIVYRLPDDDTVVFHANPGGDNAVADFGADVIVQPFDASLPATHIIAECDAAALLALNARGLLPAAPAQEEACPKSTSRDEYLRSLSAVIDSLRRGDGRKVVISRIKVVETRDLDKVALADAVFSEFRRAFCFFYYHPSLGLWLGASPELLLGRDGCGILHTMALAGTRPAGTCAPWDRKNIEEHRAVTDFIVEKLRSCELQPEVGECATLPYGKAIEHLCTKVSARASDSSSFKRVLEALHPTPALCGYPVGFALEAIGRAEAHCRSCYGGYISVGDAAYVNLRCARIYSDGSCCLFAGGGIMPDSDPDDEWAETERKASSLLSIIRKCQY